MTEFGKLLLQIPPDRRADAALALEKLANDYNSPIFSLYAELLASVTARNQSEEARDKQIAAQIAAAHTQNLKAIHQEFATHTGETFWKRIRNLQFVGVALWLVLVTVCSLIGSHLIYNYQLADLKKINQAQKQILETITDDPAALVAYSRFSHDAHKEANRSIPTIAGIAAMLKLPQSTLGLRDDKLIIALNSNDVSCEVKNGRTYIGFTNQVPELSGMGFLGMLENIDQAEQAREKINPK